MYEESKEPDDWAGMSLSSLVAKWEEQEELDEDELLLVLAQRNRELDNING